jgi:hypothetical protein
MNSAVQNLTAEESLAFQKRNRQLFITIFILMPVTLVVAFLMYHTMLSALAAFVYWTFISVWSYYAQKWGFMHDQSVRERAVAMYIRRDPKLRREGLLVNVIMSVMLLMPIIAIAVVSHFFPIFNR